MTTSKALLAACVLAAMLTACKGGGNDAVARRRAERFGAPTPTAQVATAIPASTPAPVAEQQVAGNVSGGLSLDPSTQFLIVAIALGAGFPTFWTVNGLRRLGGRK